MPAKTIILTFSADGSTQIETKGFKGKACQEATKKLIAALGTATDDTPKPEAYQAETTTTTTRTNA